MNMNVLRWCCCRVILVLKKQRVTAIRKPVFAKYTDPLYSVERFLQAFPSEKVDFPDDIETYDEKEFVCLPKRATKKGRPQVLRRASQGEEDIETAHVYTAPKKQSGRKNIVFYRDESDDEETSAQEETVDGVPVDNSWLVVQKNILLGKDDVYEGTFPSFRKRLWLDEVEGLPESDMAESSSSDEDENSETEVATVEQSNNRKKRNTPLDTEEDSGHFSDSHSSLEPTSRYSRPPNRKMPRLIRSGVSETAISSCVSEETRILTRREKVIRVISCNISNFIKWDGYYVCSKMTDDDPRFLQRNEYPSPDNPALIPIMFKQSRRIVESLKPKGMELGRPKQHPKQIPIVSKSLITKFLSIVHLNTVMGLQSQAFAYSRNYSGAVLFLGVFPQLNQKDTVSDVNRTMIQKDFFHRLFDVDKLAPRGSNYVLRCWIIVHPTTNVFYQLKRYCSCTSIVVGTMIVFVLLFHLGTKD